MDSSHQEVASTTSATRASTEDVDPNYFGTQDRDINFETVDPSSSDEGAESHHSFDVNAMLGGTSTFLSRGGCEPDPVSPDNNQEQARNPDSRTAQQKGGAGAPRKLLV